MVNIRIALLILILYIGAVMLFAVNAIYNHEIGNSSNQDSSNLNNTTFNNLSIENSSIENSSIAMENSIRENPTLPSQEYVMQNINWSNYTLLLNPYFRNFEVSDPTYVNDHKFLYVVIVVEINDASNKTEIFSQLSGVVLEERKLLGPNSGPTVWGTVDGMMVYYAAQIPCDTTVYKSYLP
jgi:hypothetical protein